MQSTSYFLWLSSLLDWRAVLYIRYIPAAEIHCSYFLSSSNWPFCAWVHRIAHYSILVWKVSFSERYLDYHVINRDRTSQNSYSITLLLWKWTWKCCVFVLYLISQGHLFPYFTPWFSYPEDYVSACLQFFNLQTEHKRNKFTPTKQQLHKQVSGAAWRVM